MTSHTNQSRGVICFISKRELKDNEKNDVELNDRAEREEREDHLNNEMYLLAVGMLICQEWFEKKNTIIWKLNKSGRTDYARPMVMRIDDCILTIQGRKCEAKDRCKGITSSDC